MIRTALLSYGMSGKVFHAPFISLHPGLELKGSWERSKKIIATDYPGVTSYGTMEDLLNDKSVDLVVVNTPTYTHFEYAKRSLEAGKHTVVEKAFTANAAEAEELKALSIKKGVKLSVFQNRRWDSDFKTVKKIVDDGVLGEVVEATFAYDRFNAALSYKVHKETPSAGSGIVKDLSPHLVDQALFLFGMPDSVFADVMITRPSSQVDDYFEILLYYKKFRVRLHSGYYVREPVPSYVVHGRNGSFLKTRGDVQETKLQAGEKPTKEGWGEPESEQGLLHTEVNGKVIREKVPTLMGNYYGYYDGIYNAIANNKEMPVTADDGIRVMRVIDAVYKSAKEGKVIGL
ncbi:MAG TPA: Gfo/Idh/MocA family oxidoreductase [Cyclobacteriaceae bacterium]|nr:Gfo/Idh/MocA family oxidoreductase [Cyclobacteriaceae bacterium]